VSELDITIDGRGVATLTLNRPAKHNALSAGLIAALAAAAARLGPDPAVRVLVLTGAGKSFCAGGDLDWMRAQIAADAAARAAEAGRLAAMLAALDGLDKPVVGRINGQAFGGGIGLIAVCDTAVAAAGARFGLTETRLGLIPATIGPYVAARLGPAARRVFFSARLFDAAEAVAMGLLARAVPAEGLDAAVEAEVAPYLACAPGAVAEGKRLLRRLAPAADAAALAETAAALVRRWEDPEAAEGIAAFFAGRKPAWAAG